MTQATGVEVVELAVHARVPRRRSSSAPIRAMTFAEGAADPPARGVLASELENNTSQTHTEALLEAGCSPEDWRPPADGGVAPVTRTRLSAFQRMIRWLTSCGAGTSGTGGDFDVRRANTQRWLRSAAT